jgi:hypothetical protein
MEHNVTKNGFSKTLLPALLAILVGLLSPHNEGVASPQVLQVPAPGPGSVRLTIEDNGEMSVERHFAGSYSLI